MAGRTHVRGIVGGHSSSTGMAQARPGNTLLLSPSRSDEAERFRIPVLPSMLLFYSECSGHGHKYKYLLGGLFKRSLSMSWNHSTVHTIFALHMTDSNLIPITLYCPLSMPVVMLECRARKYHQAWPQTQKLPPKIKVHLRSLPLCSSSH